MLILIFAIGFVSSFIGAMVGGGALLSIPALILLGLPPHVAVATNKVGGIGLSLAALYRYGKANKIEWSISRPLSILGIVGGALGAIGLLEVRSEQLQTVVAFLLFLLLPLLLWKPNFGLARRDTSSRQKAIGATLYFLLMVFGGFFGGGIGPFIIAVLVGFYGLTIIEANATDFFPWLLQSLTSLVILTLNGYVPLCESLSIFVGMIAGGYYGAGYALKRGDRFIHTTLTILVAVMAVKLLIGRA